MTTIEFKTKLSKKVKRFCFFGSVEEMILFEEIVILEPGIKIFCFESSVSLTSILSRVNGSSMVRVVAFISPDIAGV